MAIPYLSVDDFTTSFSIINQNALWEAAQNDPSFPTFVSASMSNASSMVNSYVQSRYIVPLATVPLDIKIQVARIADYLIICRRGFIVKGTDDIYRNNYEEAKAFLMGVKNGSISIDSAPVSGSSVGETPELDTQTVYVSDAGFFGGSDRNW